MNTIPVLIASKDYKALLDTCEQEEIQYNQLEIIYPIYLAGCILTNDLQSARHVRKRILVNKTSSPEIEAIWTVVVDLIKKAYPQVYQDLSQFEWSEWMQPLIEQIKENTREHLFYLISQVYTSMELSQASQYFGVSEEEALQEMTNRGWKYNESTRILYPTKTTFPTLATTHHPQHFEKLADIVLSLEKF
ncbi:COP9 signalosome [Gilbertella persicaria]|uniref:COP9 signalosome n=1 Tax=Gilbertella persicaria TaxID=101096 RepID=UPI00222002CD|nr:COP9 signalosome [Gilbertella persicaria]KAI8054982.1 COP9 signalosome [Gilbertella persicaria]